MTVPLAQWLGETVAAAAAFAAAASVMCDAATAGNLDELRRALDSGADLNALVPRETADGEECETTALIQAAGAGQLEAAVLLLDRAASPDKPDSFGTTPLMMAAELGHVAVTGLLAERGADLHALYNREGGTAFHCACASNQPGCVEVLVRAGCNTAAETKDGLTGKQYAEKRGNTEVLDCLRDLVAERLGEAIAGRRHNGNLLSPSPLSQGATR